MENNKKYFIKIVNGNLQAGSGEIRKTKPKQGNWFELEVSQCCAPALNITATPAQTSGNDWDFSLSCSGGGSIFVFIPGGAVTDIDSLTEFLNDSLGYLGRFSTDGTTITL